MSGDVHVRFCESRGVRFPPATHHTVLSDARLAIWFPGMPTDRVTDADGGGFLFVMNGAEHLRARRAVGAAVGSAQLQRVRQAAERIATEWVAALVAAGEPADVIGQVGVPLAAGRLAALLGVPEELAGTWLDGQPRWQPCSPRQAATRPQRPRPPSPTGSLTPSTAEPGGGLSTLGASVSLR